jgi:hypothetical protein
VPKLYKKPKETCSLEIEQYTAKRIDSLYMAKGNVPGFKKKQSVGLLFKSQNIEIQCSV